MGIFSFRASFQRRIILLVGLGMLLLVAALGISSQMAVNTSIDRVLQERLVLAKTTAEYLQYVLDQNLARLEDVALAGGQGLAGGDLEREKAALHDALLGSIFEVVFIADRSGRILLVEPPMSSVVGKNDYVHPRVGEAVSSEKPLVSRAYVGDGGRKIISMIVPLRDREGRIAGVVGGDVDLTGANLGRVVQTVSLGKTGYVEVVDDQGVVLAASNTLRLLSESDHGNTLSTLIRSKEPVVSTCHGGCHVVEKGVEREAEIMAFAPLPRVSWGVAIRQTEQEALAPARTLRQRFWLLSGFLVALSLGMAWGVGKSLARPIRELTSAAQRISSGNLSNPIPSFGEDEVGELARSLDSMRKRLGSSLEEIQRWNKELEARVQERTEQLEASNRERRELLNKVISAQEDERKRIARELHDETSQYLAALVMNLDTVASPEGTAPFPRLGAMKDTAIRALEGIHQIIFDLRPSVLDDLGLLPALRWYAESKLKNSGVKVHLEVNGDEMRLPSQLEIALFRVVQEAVTNISKHARAENVMISIEYKEGSVVIEVEDDGEGFDLTQVVAGGEKSRGLGLLGMKERVELLGGSINIDSAPGTGTRLSVEVPL